MAARGDESRSRQARAVVLTRTLSDTQLHRLDQSADGIVRHHRRRDRIFGSPGAWAAVRNSPWHLGRSLPPVRLMIPMIFLLRFRALVSAFVIVWATGREAGRVVHGGGADRRTAMDSVNRRQEEPGSI